MSKVDFDVFEKRVLLIHYCWDWISRPNPNPNSGNPTQFDSIIGSGPVGLDLIQPKVYYVTFGVSVVSTKGSDPLTTLWTHSTVDGVVTKTHRRSSDPHHSPPMISS